MEFEVALKDSVSSGLKQIQSAVIRFVGAVTAGIAALSALTYPVRQAIEYERALVDIAKTTGFTTEQINRVGDALLDMSLGTSRSATELANIAAVAGQLGLGTTAGADGVVKFTNTIQKAATALELLEEDAAKMGATIFNIFNFFPYLIRKFRFVFTIQFQII
jgi:hypothetical protein